MHKQLNKRSIDRLGYLYDRWQDEREYEDFADYQKEAQKLCDQNGVTFKGLSKRPFILAYDDGDNKKRVTVHVNGSAIREAYSPIK